MNILGISAFYHDSAACLVQEGEVVAAAGEERFTRKKHDEGFPHNAISFCLESRNLSISEIDYVAFYDKPLLKFERLLQTYVHTAPSGLSSFLKAMPLWLKDKLWILDKIKNELEYKGEVLFTEHHQSHAGSAFYPSPFDEAAVLTIDGVGEWTTNSLGIGSFNDLKIIKEIKFPHSVGLLYSAFTYYCGFKVNSGEYKLMGLAPYGTPRYVNLIYDNLIDLKEDGSYRLNQEYFNYMAGLTMTNGKFSSLFSGQPRKPETPISQREMDLARSVQEVVEECVLRQGRFLHSISGQENLCMAGGVALNCVANGRLLREGPFKNIWIQPASGDAGGAIGAAMCAFYGMLAKPRDKSEAPDRQNSSFLGPYFEESEIISQLDKLGAVYERLDDNALFATASELLSKGSVMGWFQGAMEFGPRALGNRSILGDPRSSDMQSRMNLKIKYRESFRPFAPAVLREDAQKYFDLDSESPYMLLVAPVKEEIRRSMTEEEKSLFGIDKLKIPRSEIPAVTHVDYSARVQTVCSKAHPRFYALLKAFKERTGCSVLVNTSFNVRGEPIVCTPEEAFTCFMRTDMDCLVVDNFLMKKTAQKPWDEDREWMNTFELD